MTESEQIVSRVAITDPHPITEKRQVWFVTFVWMLEIPLAESFIAFYHRLDILRGPIIILQPDTVCAEAALEPKFLCFNATIKGAAVRDADSNTGFSGIL